MASTLRKAQRTTINRALNARNEGDSLGQHRNTPALAMEALLDAGYSEKATLKMLRKAGIKLPAANVVAEATEYDWGFIEAAHYGQQAMVEAQVYTMQVTEAPVGTCDDCGLEGGHVEGCTFAPKKVEHLIPLDQPILTLIQKVECIACGTTTACRLVTRVKNTGLGLCPSCEVAAPDLATKSTLVEA